MNWLNRLLYPLWQENSPGQHSRRPTLESLEERAVPAIGFGGAFAIGDGGEWARDIATDDVGNTYVTGIFNGTVDFDPGAGEAFLTSVSGQQNGFVAKYDGNGAYQWAVRLGGSGQSVAVLSDGSGVAVTGSFRGTGNFGPVTLSSSADSQDAFVARLDGAGSVQWAKQWGGTNDFDMGSSVAFDTYGNVYAAGQVSLTPGSTNVNTDAYAVKYNGTDGQVVKTWQFGGSMGDSASSILVDSSGVWIGGNFRGTADFNPGTRTYKLSSGGRSVQPSEAGFVMKLDSNGSFAWASHFQASQWSASRVTDLARAPGSGVYVVGNFTGTVDFDPSNKGNLRLTRDNAGYALRLNAQGQLGSTGWVQTFVSTDTVTVYAATSDTAGNLYLAGSYIGTVDLNPGNQAFSRTSAGGEDAFAVKLNANGQFQWGASMGGVNVDRAQGIAVHDNDVYMTGLFQGPADYDPTEDYALLYGPYTSMFWLNLTDL